MKLRAILFTLAIGALSVAACTRVEAPQPVGALPSAAQVEWQKMEYYMFIHFGPNTFTSVEWGDGKEDPRVFAPTALDCRQWAATAKAAGMKAIILTAKHHDGFCLWPSQYSTHTVREAGQPDVVKLLSEACAEQGLKFGVYLSPWDQNHPTYGTAEYNQLFANTLNEVLSGYGPVFEQWFDGANGHANGGAKIPPYDWAMFHEVVYRNQPQAIIFSDIGPGCRWMGNERGVAGETNWSTLNVAGFTPGLGAPDSKTLNEGNPRGEAWVPAETDVSIRPGWFYTAEQDSRVKSTAKLMDIYYTSVGRNSNLLLNVPPDQTGRINAIDSVRLMEFRAAREEAFKENLLAGAKVKASNGRGGEFSAKRVLDGNYDSYWATADGVTTGALEFDLGSDKTFNRVLLQEYIPLGQRVESFSLSYRDAKGEWVKIADATTIGYKRILRFGAVSARQIRIEFWASAPLVVSAVELYNAPEIVFQSTVQQAPFRTVKLSEPQFVDLGASRSVRGFVYTPHAQEQAPNIARYTAEVSVDGTRWTIVKSDGRFDNIANSPVEQRVEFEKIVTARYLRITALEAVGGGDNYEVVKLEAITE